jgi:hypothetical protein
VISRGKLATTATRIRADRNRGRLRVVYASEREDVFPWIAKK